MVLALFFYLLALICWLGGMVFFAFITAPIVFTRLPIVEAGKVVSGIFPLYYLMGYGAGGLALALAIYLTLASKGRLWWSLSALMLAMALGLFVYAGAVIGPKVDALRTVPEVANPDPARKAEFDRLHKLSVQLNGAALVLEVLTVLTTAAALV